MNPTSNPNGVECDRPRSMSQEDEMMFRLGRPFEDGPNANTPNSTPPSSPAKSPQSKEKSPLRPISMPEPFKI